MKLRLMGSGFLLCAASSVAAQTAAPPQPKTTRPQTKEFTLALHFNYQERRYAPPVLVPLTPPAANPPATSEQPATNAQPPNGQPANGAEATERRFASAEQSLFAQLAALQSGDFAAWLNTWDEAARKQTQARGAAFAEPNGAWRQLWQAKFRPGDNVTLTRWILTGPYVILTYRVGRGDEIAVAFHLAGEGWKATLELENDPVLLHFGDGKTKIEKTIR